MAAIRIYRRLQDQRDVDPNGLPDGGVPQYQTAVSSFVVETIAAGGNSFSLGASSLGNTLGDTGVTGTRLVLAGIGRITLSQSTDAAGGTITISGGTAGAGAFSGGVSNVGNTDGVTGITGTQVVFAGGNNITLSQSVDGNGGTITVVGPTTVAQSVQTQNLFDLTLDGNTAGALAVVSSGTLTLAGGNSITLSQNGNAITISGATTSQSVQTQPIQTGISSIVASNATYTSGSVQFTGSNMITVRSSANQRVVIDATQSVQTQGLFDMTISGNTAGAGALVSSGTLTLAGGSNITLSQNGNAISIIGNAAGTETQVAISGIANSQTTYTSGTVSLSELGAITIRSTTGNQFQLSVNPQSVQPETQTFLGGLAGSNTTYTSGTVTITGVGGGITVSSNTGQRIDLSVAAQSAESQSIGMSNIGNTSGTTGIASGAQVRMLFAGGNSITLSQSLNGASGTLTISGPNLSQSLGMSNIGNTSGTTGIASGSQVRFLFAGGNNITLSQSLNGASGTITISGPNTAAQTNQSLGMYAVQNTTGQSSSTTMDARTISVAGDGAVSVGYSAGSLRISAPTQTVQTQNMVAVTLSGNTSGAQALISSGTLTLAGGNNITVSQAGNAVTISGPNVGGAQTGISGIIASDATYTSGTVQFTGSNMITVKSSAGQRVVIDATQSVQTQGQMSAGVSTGGNTAGDTGVTGTRLVFVGSNNITLSQATAAAGGTITISGPTTAAQTNQSGGAYAVGNTYSSSSGTFDARTISIRGDGIISVAATNSGWRISASQSVQAETQTFVGGLAASNTTYTSGTITITGVGGGITVSSNTGQRIDLSVAAPVAQTVQSLGMYAVQNTTGQSSSTTMDARTLSVAGDGAVSVGYSAGSLRISAPVQTGTQFSAGISGGNTAGDTGTVAGRVVLAGGANITLSGSTNGASETISIVGGAGGAFSAGISGGNTSGDTGATGTRVVLAGGNNITLSGATDANGGSVTVSAPNASVISAVAPLSTTTNGSTISILGPAQLSVGFSTQGNTSGNTGFVTGQLQLVGSNGITLSGSTNAGSQTITISGITQSVESQSIGMSNLGNTSGTTGIASGGQVRFLLAGGNGVTLSQSLNGASGTLTISVANQSVESQSFGMSNIGNTSGTTGIASGGQVRFLLAGGNNITLSQSINGASGTITISAPNAVAQTVQSLGMYAVQNTTGQSSSTTMDARTISIAGDGAVSVGYSAGSLRISAPTQTVESQSIGMSNVGNTSGTTGMASGGQVRFVFAGGNNITLSQSLNGASGTITISAPNLGAGAMSAGVSNLGNSAGATGITGTQLVLVGSDNITLSQTTGANGGTVSIIGGGGGFSAGVSTGGNTAGATGVSGTRMVLVGTNAISLSQTTGAAGNTVSIDAPATSSLVGVAPITISTNGSTISIDLYDPLVDWENMPRAQASLISHVSAFSKTPIYWNDHIDGDILAKSMAFAISMVTASQPLSVSAHLGVYTLVNSTSAALLGSLSEAYVVSSASSVSLSGVRNLVMTKIGTHATLSSITAGEYLLGMMFSATATNAMNFSLLGASGGAGPLGGIYPGTNQLSAGTTQGIQQLAGRGSVTVNAMPANVVASDVINQGQGASMALHPWIYIRS